MDNIWLERVGIIMNCLAGFMIAPELIGDIRLIRLSDWMQKFVKKIQEYLIWGQQNNWTVRQDFLISYMLRLNPQRKNQSLHTQYTVGYTLLLIFSLTLWAVIWLFVHLYVENNILLLYAFCAYNTFVLISIILLPRIAGIWSPARRLASLISNSAELYSGLGVATLYLLSDVLNLILKFLFHQVTQHKFRHFACCRWNCNVFSGEPTPTRCDIQII